MKSLLKDIATLFVLFLPVVLVSCAPQYLNDAPETKYSHDVLSKEAQEGRKIFNSPRGFCFACHGLDADTVTRLHPVHPRLNPRPTNLRHFKILKYKQDEEVFNIIRDGIPETSMVSFKHLTEKEISLIISYLNEIRLK